MSMLVSLCPGCHPVKLICFHFLRNQVRFAGHVVPRIRLGCVLGHRGVLSSGGGVMVVDSTGDVFLAIDCTVAIFMQYIPGDWH